MKGRPSQAILERRFWEQVAVAGPDACWLWNGHLSHNGYGIRYWNRREQVAHRIAYELAGGVIAPGLLLRHRCDVKRCCNPEHLEPGTHADNMRDMKERGRAAKFYGAANKNAKLSDDQVIVAIAMRLGGRSLRQVGTAFGVHNQTISRIERGLRWKKPEVAK